MTYIENIFICLAIPMILSMFFTKRETRKSTLFFVTGMVVCMIAAYISSFFVSYYNEDALTAVVEIAPVCEEVMKLLPLMFYLFIFEPPPSELPHAAISMAVGFATFENACYLTENGAEDFTFLLIRGLAAGALHILCGIICGFGLSYVFRRYWLAFTGTLGILGLCIVLHAIYNLLVTTDGVCRIVGYFFPSILIIMLLISKQVNIKSILEFKN